MKPPFASWLLVPVIALTLAGCPKQQEESTTSPPGGPPASGPPGPGVAAPPGTPANPTGHPTPLPAGSTGNEVMVRKVKNALITQKVYTANVGVSVNGGAITLSGSVPTAQQKSTAVAAAKQVPGVSSVTDKLTVGGAK